jgi:hypothetical protein
VLFNDFRKRRIHPSVVEMAVNALHPRQKEVLLVFSVHGPLREPLIRKISGLKRHFTKVYT